MKRSAGRRFAYRMAVKLGIVNVDRDILRGITAKQFRDWQHYASLEPFDETRADYRAASIVSMIYNVNRGKDDKVMTIEDARLKFEQSEKRKQTWQDQLYMLKLIGMQASMNYKAEKR